MAPSATLAASAALLCLLAAAGVSAHGGGLHRWTLNPDVLEVIPHAPFRDIYAPWLRVAVASNWTVLDTTSSSVKGSYFMPSFDPPNNEVEVAGSIGIYVYLISNCTDSPQTTLIADLAFVKHVERDGTIVTLPYGKAYKHVQAYAYTFTGTCSAPGNLYRQDPMAEDDRFNLAYWNKENFIGTGMNETDRVDGYLWGAAPNSYLVRGPEQAANGTVPLSVVLVVQGAATFCAPLEWEANPEDAMAWGHDCNGEGGGHGR